MKPSILVIAFLLINYLAMSQTRSMGSSGIIGKLQAIIDLAEERDMEVVRVEADIIRNTKECIRSLDPSYTYTITAVGSNKISDIDIEVYKNIEGSWTLIKKDADAKGTAVVQISPSSFSEYKVVVKAYKFIEGYDVGHYGLVFIHD